MDIHTINIPGGYSGSVVVKTGTCSLEFPEFIGTMSSGKWDLKYYHLWLLTPEKNIELQLFRLPSRVCDDGNCFSVPSSQTNKTELLNAIKKVIIKMGI
jgi:hypothetical protein